MNINRLSLIILIITGLSATIISNGLSILIEPWTVIRTLIMVITLISCFLLINFSDFKKGKLILLCSFLSTFTILIEAFIPALRLDNSELFKKLDITYIEVLFSHIRVVGYLLTFFIAVFIANFVEIKTKNKPDKTRKMLKGITYLFAGSIGGTIFSAFNHPDAIIVTALTGFVFSAMLYCGFMITILIKKVPETNS